MPLRFKRIAVPAGVLLLALYGCVYLVRQPMTPEGPPLTDFAAYVAAGRAWLQGIDPYGTGIWITERTLPGFDPARFELLPYLGPPAGLPVWAALSALPYPLAALVWGAFVTSSAFALLVLAARIADRRLTPAVLGSLGLIGVAAAPIVTIAGSALAVVLCIGIVAVIRATRADLVDGAAIACAFVPLMLPARYSVAGAASASAVWRAEIVASGLTERRPWTAVLRLVTLFGCAGIGFAMVRVAAVRAAERAHGPMLVPIIETQVSMVDTGPPQRHDRNIVSMLRSRREMSVARGRERL